MQIGEDKYGVGIKGVLSALNRRLEQNASAAKTPQVGWDPYPTGHLVVKGDLNQDYLWDVCYRESKIYSSNG
jgi:hypothetical protein